MVLCITFQIIGDSKRRIEGKYKKMRMRIATSLTYFSSYWPFFSLSDNEAWRELPANGDFYTPPEVPKGYFQEGEW